MPRDSAQTAAPRAFGMLKRSLRLTPPAGLLLAAAAVVVALIWLGGGVTVHVATALTGLAVALAVLLVVVYERAWIRAGQAVQLS